MHLTRIHLYVVGVVVALAAVEIFVFASGIGNAGWLVPMAAVVAVIAGRVVGLAWSDLGLSRASLGSGLRYSLVIVAVVTAVAAIGVALPPTRELFRNDAYPDLASSAFAAFVLIPLRTVLAEEFLFRGALLGALGRLTSSRLAVIGQAVAFGCWHVGSSMGLAAHNQGIGNVVGTGTPGIVAGVLLAVTVTSLAGILLGWLRIRSGSILAPIALHWSVNGIGAIAAALAWHWT